MCMCTIIYYTTICNTGTLNQPQDGKTAPTAAKLDDTEQSLEKKEKQPDTNSDALAPGTLKCVCYLGLPFVEERSKIDIYVRPMKTRMLSVRTAEGKTRSILFVHLTEEGKAVRFFLLQHRARRSL